MDWIIFGDYFFFIFHLVFVVFILFGWMVPSWRKLHLVAILLTLFSWFGLGLFYGWGFCPLTEWHWQILRKAGERDLPFSYVAYLLERSLGLQLADALVDGMTTAGAFLALLASLWVNFFTKTGRNRK